MPSTVIYTMTADHVDPPHSMRSNKNFILSGCAHSGRWQRSRPSFPEHGFPLPQGNTPIPIHTEQGDFSKTKDEKQADRTRFLATRTTVFRQRCVQQGIPRRPITVTLFLLYARPQPTRRRCCRGPRESFSLIQSSWIECLLHLQILGIRGRPDPYTARARRLPGSASHTPTRVTTGTTWCQHGRQKALDPRLQQVSSAAPFS